jgi:sugar lactone lactonase YvrE
MNLKIQGAKFLNDVTTDSLGSLYITDIGMNKVIKLNLNTWKYLTFVNTDYEAPNGILFEKSGERLIICYFSDKSAVQAISLEDTSITTLYSKDLINLDGIASDDNGNIYVSSWGPGSFSSGFKNKGLIYKFEKTFINLPELITTDHFGRRIFFLTEK